MRLVLKTVATLCVSLVLLTGCFEKRIDGSSKETFDKSVAEVKKELKQEELKDFENAMQVIAMSNVQGLGDVLLMVAKPDNYENFLMKRVNGMTAKQVIKEADEIIKAKGKEDSTKQQQ